MIEFPYSAHSARYENGMQYRRCGQSGILMSSLSLGMWHNFGASDSFANAKAMAHYAFDHGITTFDLANNYGVPYGSAENTFGQLLQMSFRPYRDELFVTTKAGHDMWPGPYGNWGSRKYLISSLDQSLKRMNLEYVDLFYSHRYDPSTPLEETMQALVDIVRSGKALYVGLSKYPFDAAEKGYAYLRAHDVPCLAYQARLSILNQDPIENGILSQAATEGVGVVAFSSLAQGLLTNRYLNGQVPTDSRMAHDAFLKKSALTEKLLAQLNALQQLAEKRGQTLAELALTWVLSHPEVSSVIIGASSIAQLQDNLHTLSYPLLSEEEKAAINRIISN
ncbi:MAG: aldo/keto reductase [Bacteroidaceae bacterium]|nr:aldo/keto reductase [Bacteroidaceae bacterium]MBP9637588.1 aldo/keto reductase [Bacteroidaceae bacterium]